MHAPTHIYTSGVMVPLQTEGGVLQLKHVDSFIPGPHVYKMHTHTDTAQQIAAVLRVKLVKGSPNIVLSQRQRMDTTFIDGTHERDLERVESDVSAPLFCRCNARGWVQVCDSTQAHLSSLRDYFSSESSSQSSSSLPCIVSYGLL